MQTSRIFRLAWRYLRGHLRRYTFLLIAVSFGFGIITTMTALSDGMAESVNRAAQEHYAGDVFVVGHDADHGQAHRIIDVDSVERALDQVGLGALPQARRTIVFESGTLYFNGTASRQKNLYGVDWSSEAAILENLQFTQGGILADLPNNAILISAPVAESLGARLGDQMILQVRTLTGQVNTGTFKIAGIFHDPSIFGYYKSYVERRTLNRLLGYGEDEYSSLGIFLPRRTDAQSVVASLVSGLAESVSVAPPVSTRHQLNILRRESWTGVRHFVLPLKVYVSEVDELLSAMRLGSYVVFAMMTLIVLVSIAVTYKLVIHERTREIGTLRAVGMQRATVRWILLTEALYLFLASLLVGLILSGLFLVGISFLSFDWIPGFEIFTRSGRLTGVVRLETLLVNGGLLLVIVFPAALIPANRAAALALTEALSTE